MTDHKLGRPTKEGRPLAAPLNLRISQEDRDLLDRLVEAERTDRQGDPFADITAASLIRSWIREKARARGFLSPPVRSPVPPPVLPASEHEAPSEPDKDAVRAALEVALKKGIPQGTIAAESEIDPSSLSHFKGRKRSLSPVKLARLAALLKGKGYL